MLCCAVQESAIREMQEHVQQLWQSQGDKYRKVLGPNVSAGNITYSMGLVSRRQGHGLEP